MYRIACDSPGCSASPSDTSDYYCWADAGQALDEATDLDWYITRDRQFCWNHAPKCSADGCRVTLRDDEWGDRCEDCDEESSVPSAGASS
jgi:hypothetical protein